MTVRLEAAPFQTLNADRHLYPWLTCIILVAVTGLVYVAAVAILNTSRPQVMKADSSLVLSAVGIGVLNNEFSAERPTNFHQSIEFITRNTGSGDHGDEVVLTGRSRCARTLGWGKIRPVGLAIFAILSNSYKFVVNGSISRSLSKIRVVDSPKDLANRWISIWVWMKFRSSNASIGNPNIRALIVSKAVSSIAICPLGGSRSLFCRNRSFFHLAQLESRNRRVSKDNEKSEYLDVKFPSFTDQVACGFGFVLIFFGMRNLKFGPQNGWGLLMFVVGSVSFIFGLWLSLKNLIDSV